MRFAIAKSHLHTPVSSRVNPIEVMVDWSACPWMISLLKLFYKKNPILSRLPIPVPGHVNPITFLESTWLSHEPILIAYEGPNIKYRV